MTSLFVVSAPSGAGKTSLVNAALQADETLSLSVSHTTRTQRAGETEGKDYYFISPVEFHALEKKGMFVEHAQVFGNFYGTSKNSIDALLLQGQDVVLEIDWQGAQQIKHVMPECITITILPPSKQALEDRLRSRKQDDDATIAKRMHEAANEMSHYSQSDYLIINNHFETALQELLAICKAERLRCKHQAKKHTVLISELLDEQ